MPTETTAIPEAPAASASSSGEPMQPAPESPSPTVETPAHEPTPATAEVIPVPATAPAYGEATPGTQDKPTPTPLPKASEGHSEPPSSAASTPAPAHPIRDFLTGARIATQDRKRKKRDKIMLALVTKNKVTNDEVEKLLHVSDATATRYLSALEKEGKIKQVGKAGHCVVYQKI
ncbi:MAG: hypothetical protein WAW90_03170 [Minisyncoccia bacterium]